MVNKLEYQKKMKEKREDIEILIRRYERLLFNFKSAINGLKSRIEELKVDDSIDDEHRKVWTDKLQSIVDWYDIKVKTYEKHVSILKDKYGE